MPSCCHTPLAASPLISPSILASNPPTHSPPTHSRSHVVRCVNLLHSVACSCCCRWMWLLRAAWTTTVAAAQCLSLWAAVARSLRVCLRVGTISRGACRRSCVFVWRWEGVGHGQFKTKGPQTPGRKGGGEGGEGAGHVERSAVRYPVCLRVGSSYYQA